MKSTRVTITKLIGKGMTVGLLAGALVLGMPRQAAAQAFGVGVQFGGPQYGYADADFAARQRYECERREAYARQEAFERQQAWQQANLRHEDWEHDRRFRDFDHDRDDRFRHGDRDDFYRGR